MTAVIESASSKDLERLYTIEKECFKEEAFTKEQILQMLDDYNTISLIAKISNEIAGFVIGMIYVERNTLHGHILTIDVEPRFQRRGIGSQLMREIEEIFRRKDTRFLHLEVREDNKSAISLYTKLGYVAIGKLNNYYGRVHGIYLRKSLA
jgi:[ribosomal protein S18]-alanine N-acetyltransferase